MKIDLEVKEIQLILSLMSYADPTGFYAKGISDKISEQANKALEVDFKEVKKEE